MAERREPVLERQASTEGLVEGTCEEEDQPVAPSPSQSWLGYGMHMVGRTARGTWAAMHYVGEKLAYGLGITSPDWQYAIDLYDTLKQEQEEEKREEEQAIREERERRLERLRQLESAGT